MTLHDVYPQRATVDDWKDLQRALNAFLKKYRVVPPLRFLFVDGDPGTRTLRTIRQVKLCLGYADPYANYVVDQAFLNRLARPLSTRLLLPRQIARGLAYRRQLRRLNPQATDYGAGYGSPGWAGSRAVCQESDYVFRSRGCYLASVKRTPAKNASVGGASNSDHLTTNGDSYAQDWGTLAGADDARAAGRHYGFPFDPVGTYRRHTVTRQDRRYSVQILWAVRGHFDHVHLGVDRLDIAG